MMYSPRLTSKDCLQLGKSLYYGQIPPEQGGVGGYYPLLRDGKTVADLDDTFSPAEIVVVDWSADSPREVVTPLPEWMKRKLDPVMRRVQFAGDIVVGKFAELHVGDLLAPEDKPTRDQFAARRRLSYILRTAITGFEAKVGING